jgi:hypothetical protein
LMTKRDLCSELQVPWPSSALGRDANLVKKKKEVRRLISYRNKLPKSIVWTYSSEVMSCEQASEGLQAQGRKDSAARRSLTRHPVTPNNIYSIKAIECIGSQSLKWLESDWWEPSAWFETLTSVEKS